MIFHHFHDFKIIVVRITLFFYKVKVLPNTFFKHFWSKVFEGGFNE